MSHPPLRIDDWPTLADPVLIMALEGWIDAGSGAQQAMAAIRRATAARPLGTFDAERFVDYRARRPTLQLRDGVSTEFTWPEIEVLTGSDPSGRDVVLMVGPEPDMRWQEFVTETCQAAVRLGVSAAVGLGAYPVAVPHTRPPLVSITTPDAQLARTSGLLRNSVDVPAGAQAALEWGMARHGMTTMGLWAQVPHYASAMPYPGAGTALVRQLNRLTGLTVDTASLESAEVEHRARLDELVSNSAEHAAMLRQLEAAFDEATGDEGSSTDEPIVAAGMPLPSGDELAAEVERFLRDQGKG